jgi:hypothetical protein
MGSVFFDRIPFLASTFSGLDMTYSATYVGQHGMECRGSWHSQSSSDFQCRGEKSAKIP